MDLRRETDIEQLRRIALAQQMQIDQLLRVLHSKCRELEELKGSPQELQRTLALIETLNEKAREAAEKAASAESPRPAAKERKPREKFGKTEQPKLPIEEQVFELDEADRVCRSCGGELRPMEGQFETSEMVDVVEVSYRVIQAKQQKYVCRCGSCVETAPGPERAIRGGRYSLGFAIKVAIDKYLDHIPLARQERILRRHGLDVTTQALWDQLSALGRRLASTDAALFERALAESVIGLDQTSWPRLEEGATKPWQMWCITAPGVVCHRIRDDKGAETFKALVGGYKGVIVCDALKTHEAGARDSPGIVLAGCWAHVFRKFEEAAPDHFEAHLALEWIRMLYEIDERAGDNLELKAELRRTNSQDFGASVALSGDTALVGAYNPSLRHALVFARSGTVWSEQAILDAGSKSSATVPEFDSFVALHGDTALVGAPLDPPDGPNIQQGSVYVFARNGSAWSPMSRLLASDGNGADFFGYSVALSSDTALIGASNQADRGAAYVFVTVGGPCATGAECLSGTCFDGICCDRACGAGPCEACSVAKGASTDGLCEIVAQGSPGSPACAPLACNGASTACVPCTTDADCSTDRYCSKNGACVLRKPQGAPCDPAVDCRVGACRICLSTFCADGFCCDSRDRAPHRRPRARLGARRAASRTRRWRSTLPRNPRVRRLQRACQLTALARRHDSRGLPQGLGVRRVSGFARRMEASRCVAAHSHLAPDRVDASRRPASSRGPAAFRPSAPRAPA